MKSTIKNIGGLVTVFCLLGILASSCKKSNAETPDEPTSRAAATPDGTREQLTQDSIFLYAKDVYLWNTSLPEYATFNPRKYGVTPSGFDQELYDLTQYSPVNTATGKPYEFPLDGSLIDAKYSYVDDISTHNVLAAVRNEKSSVDLEGVGDDLGIKIGAYGPANSETYNLYIQAVFQGSSADLKKLTRGCMISKINKVSYGTNYTNERDAVNSALNGSSVTLSGLLKDGVTPFNVTLSKTTYKSSPIYNSQVLDVSGVKVGYLAYARFSNMDNSKADFDAAFAKFAAQNVTKLVIDLRYNGGGYVNTAEYLVNLIASSSQNGKVMFKERYNTMMQSGTATIMKNQPLFNSDGTFQKSTTGRVLNYGDLKSDYFSEAKQITNISKAGPLNGVTDVAFIVTRNTASASELVINSLKPYVNVKIAGTKSYGKPVGFFPITIDYKVDASTKQETGYDVYYSMFQTTNSLGEGNYFDGFTPDLSITTDDATHDFGDLKENNLAKALTLIVPTAPTATASTMSIQGTRVSSSSVTVKRTYGGNEFNGMIAERPRLKQ